MNNLQSSRSAWQLGHTEAGDETRPSTIAARRRFPVMGVGFGLLVAFALMLGCMPADLPPEPPTATSSPAGTIPPTETPLETEAPSDRDVQAGATLWPATRCAGCHGSAAQGGSGPRLAGTAISEDRFQEVVRSGRGRMPAFPESQLSDAQLLDLYAWLLTLQR